MMVREVFILFCASCAVESWMCSFFLFLFLAQDCNSMSHNFRLY